MNRKTLALSIPIALLSAFFTGKALSTNPSPAQGQEPPSKEKMAEMMKKMTAASTPGKPHRFLDYFIGKWKIHVKMWMMGPNGPATESDGESEVKWILDGHYMREEFHSKFLMPDPKDPSKMKMTEFHGFGFTGYDNFRKVYTGTWMDNTGTAMSIMRGSRDPSGKILTFYAEMDEPALDICGKIVKYQNRIIDKDTHIFQMFDLYMGDNYKMMEMTYTRVK